MIVWHRQFVGRQRKITSPFRGARQQTTLPATTTVTALSMPLTTLSGAIVWAKSASSGLLADGSGNGIVDQADYDVWKMHFGQTAQITFNAPLRERRRLEPGGSGVPEPRSCWLLLVGCRSRRTRSVSTGFGRFVCQKLVQRVTSNSVQSFAVRSWDSLAVGRFAFFLLP